MRIILSFVTSLLLLFTITSPVLAAPTAILTTDKLRHYTYLTFTDTKNVSKINYTLVYDTKTYQKGFEGSLKNYRSSRLVRRQILGSCSSGRCVYTPGAKNLELNVTFTLRTGGTINVVKTLP